MYSDTKTEQSPLVSILCVAYNHERYIRQTLDGFLMQRTGFAFEVLIHDDASSDGTAGIIREYAEKYPEIIRPVFQKENQYSKKVHITRTFLHPMVRGKYLCLCDGDDYWTDPGKLRKQVDFLETHPDFSACVHNSLVEYAEGKRLTAYPRRDRVLGLADVACDGCQSYQSSSLMYRSAYLGERPEFMNVTHGIGDYSRAIFLALKGKIMYFGKPMSVFRRGIEGSWTARIGLDRKKRIRQSASIIKMLKLADTYSERRYSKVFAEAIRCEEGLGAFGGTASGTGLPDGAKLFLRAHFPRLYLIRRQLRGRMKGKKVQEDYV